jgi:site-specific DNA recombinase
LRELAGDLAANWKSEREQLLQSLKLQIDALNARLQRLMDVYLEGAVDRSLFEEKKLALLLERKSLEEQRDHISGDEHIVARKIDEYLELAKMVPLSYDTANGDEKRQLLKSITSNLSLDHKNVVIELKAPFFEVSNLNPVLTGAPVRGRHRTRAKKIFNRLVSYYTAQEEEARQRSEATLKAA